MTRRMFTRTPPRNKPRLIPPPPGTARCPECGGMASHGRPGNPNRRKDKTCPFRGTKSLATANAVQGVDGKISRGNPLSPRISETHYPTPASLEA